MNFYFFLVVCATIGFVYTLECGAPNRQNRSEVKRIASICLKGNKTKEQAQQAQQAQHSEEHASEESSDEGGFDITEDAYGYRRRHRRSEVHNDKNQSNENDKEGNDDQKDVPNYQDTDIPDSCVVRCIFERLGLMNAKGYPDHAKVSHAFLRNAQGRELRDFLQGSTDECFHLMEQVIGDRLDSCMFTAQLVKCLADKGKSNCSDWETNDLPFVYAL